MDWPSKSKMDGPDPEPMDWESSDFGPTQCSTCKKNCFPHNLLLPHLLSDSSSLLPVVASCGHVVHQDCFPNHKKKCPIDDCCDIPKNSSINEAPLSVKLLRRGFPCFPFTEDDYILQLTLSHFYNSLGPSAPRVLSADIVTNAPLKARFEEKKQRLAARDLGDSLLLFHGTPNVNVSSICSFNFSLAKPVANGRVHGDGVYFTERWNFS